MLALAKEPRLTVNPTADTRMSRDHLWSAAQRARLVRLCSAITGDAVAAEDLAQETLLEAWRHQARLTDPAGSDAWLGAIARNVCRRWLRARGSGAVPTADTDLLDRPGEAYDLDAVLEREEVVELLDQALGLLSQATRAALVGHYVEELSHAEIAERIGTSADAVSMRVSRGRSRLRYLLETRFADDAVAQGWSRDGSAGWRDTRLHCGDCGRAGVQLRHDDSEVAFRCRTCAPEELSTRLPLDAPAFAELIGPVRRPSAILARLADWTQSYWASAELTCARCGRAVLRRQYHRPDARTWSTRHGWLAECAACGEEVTSSVAGLALALPEVREARRSEPRLRALPVRDVVRDGRPAKVLGFGGPDGSRVVDAVFLRDSLQLVHVDG